MTTVEVNQLLNKYVELSTKASLAKTNSDKLNEEATISRDQLIASLYKLFRENQIYHCPECGGVVSLQTRHQPVDDVYYFWCSSCKTKSRCYTEELDALVSWKNQCEGLERERQAWENLPLKKFKYTGTVRFHTEWIVTARDANEAQKIMHDNGFNFDKEHWREDPAENIKRTFLYPWLAPGDTDCMYGIPVEIKEE